MGLCSDRQKVRRGFMRILLVEDSRRLQEAIATGLRELGYAVDIATDGEDALARRSHGIKTPRIAIDDLIIDTAACTVTRAGAAIELTPREYSLLEFLAFHRGQVVSRTAIEQHIYDDRVEPLSNVVDSAICM